MNGAIAVEVTCLGWHGISLGIDRAEIWLILEIMANFFTGFAGRLLPCLVWGMLCELPPGRAADPRINEFVADNKAGLSDSDRDEVDWLEIYNPNPVPLDLAGWYLSDSAADPQRWQFPAVSVNANGYLVVFASGKDRRAAGQELHTNFSLRAAGEQLLLTKPDGLTVVSQINFGPQVRDVSYGATSITSSSEVLIGPQAAGRALVPPNGSLGQTWTQPGFNDNAWAAGTMDLGYENLSGYENLIRLNVRPAMNGIRASCYLRLPFAAVPSADVLTLTLRMRYDDGFAAWLNGTPLPTASRNAPATPVWNSAATADHDDLEAVQYEDINLSQHLSLLNAAGPNVLAVHGLNSSSTSSDFLIGPQLILTRGIAAQGFMTQPTPGAANTTGVEGFVADTHFSVDRGFYEAPVEVAISCATPEAVIRYTRNGDTPTATTGFSYVSPILIDATTVLRAAAFRPGWQPSNTDTHTYLFTADVVAQSPDGGAPTGWPASPVNGQRFDYGMDPQVLAQVGTAPLRQALTAIPTVSLVTDLPNLIDPNTGIYVLPQERGEEAERPVSLEIIKDPMNPGTHGFQQDGGLRVRGGFSRDPNNPKHSFRLFFRSRYGKGKMDYPLFGGGVPSDFDGFDLRTSQDASWAYLGSGENTFLRDEVSRATQVEIAPGSRIRYFHVYLNGQYWGLYNTDERPNKGYGEQYLGGGEDDYDVVKTSGYPGGHTTEANDGTMVVGSGWHKLWTGARAVRANPVNANYFKLMGRAADGITPVPDPVVLDAVNLADYLLVLFYMGGNDGPVSDYVGTSNNWFGVRNRNRPGGFQFFIHDFEQALGLEDGCNQRVGNGPDVRPWSDIVAGANDYTRSNPEFIHEDLAWNAEYRVLFGDRAHRHFFNNGVMTDTNMLVRINGLAAQIDTAIHAESARWGDAVRAQPYGRTDWLAARQRLEYFILTGTRQSGGPGRRNLVIEQLRAYDGGTKPLYPLLDAPVFSQHGGGLPAAGGAVTISQGNAGSPVIYHTTDGSDPRAVGGAVVSGALTYDGAVPLAGWTVVLKSRVRSGTAWSALNEAVFTRSGFLPPLIITEIHSVPAAPSIAEQFAGFTNKADFEFIEITNAGSEPLNLRDIRGTMGLNFVLTDTVLAPGGRAVIVSRLAAFRQRYGPGPLVAGTFTGSLADGGERIALTAANGSILTDFRYDTAAPWPEGLTGHSLVRRSVEGDAGRPENWRSSVAPGGSPGTDETENYLTWKDGLENPEDNDDSDHDGLPVLVEYAVGGSLTADDSSRYPAIQLGPPAAAGGPPTVLFTYVRQRGRDDVRAVICRSIDLIIWQPAPAVQVSGIALPDGTERITMEVLPEAPAESGAAPVTWPRTFLRLRWETQP